MANEQTSPNVVQATGQVATEVVGGLKNQPMLLAIVCLNVIGIGIAGYVGLQFLKAVQAGDAADREVLREMLTTNRTAMQELLGYCFDGRGNRQPVGGPR